MQGMDNAVKERPIAAPEARSSGSGAGTPALTLAASFVNYSSQPDPIHPADGSRATQSEESLSEASAEASSGASKEASHEAPQEASTEAAPLQARLRSLRAIVAVLQRGTVRAAAEELHLSQPAVTRALRDIEDQLGFPLFERAARGMLPTAAGRILGHRARQAFEHLAQACACAMALSPRADPARHGPARFAAMVGPQPLASLMAVADQGSGPRAGHSLGRSQPTIFRHLVELEHLVGLQLFQRTPRGTRLTPSGEAILRGAKLAWAEIDNAQDELAAFAGRLHGSVRVAALPLSSGFLLPRALDGLLREHPQLRITVVDGTYEALLQQLRCAEVDMIVGALRPLPAPADVAQQLLFEDKLAVIVRPQHPCIAAGKALNLADLARQPWIVPLPGTPARAVFEQVFDAEGLASPDTQLQVNSPSVVRSLLMETDRIALLSPWQVGAELRSGQLVALPLALRAATRAIGVSMRRDGHLSPGALALLAELRAVAQQLESTTAGANEDPGYTLNASVPAAI